MFRLIKKLIKLGLIVVILVGAMIQLFGYFKYKEKSLHRFPLEKKLNLFKKKMKVSFHLKKSLLISRMQLLPLKIIAFMNMVPSILFRSSEQLSPICKRKKSLKGEVH